MGVPHAGKVYMYKYLFIYIYIYLSSTMNSFCTKKQHLLMIVYGSYYGKVSVDT